ncbi:hypothetical protein KIN20_032707 [Parelaphostrongylus tenuis]|uniref:Uncharacterized protein n=1 Tax=Parelaphostrongylus tenuis TaxID=148309 RepID=A0AAD5R719_PARTN|nr:hypothetical protein KIN20_032707 [Parelaphostrongylus tenuis]
MCRASVSQCSSPSVDRNRALFFPDSYAIRIEDSDFQPQYCDGGVASCGKAGRRPDTHAQIIAAVAPRGKATASRRLPVNAAPQKVGAQ